MHTTHVTQIIVAEKTILCSLYDEQWKQFLSPLYILFPLCPIDTSYPDLYNITANANPLGY